MTDTTPQFAIYNGQPVIIEEVFSTEHGNHAFISFDDGREEEVPFSSLDLL